MEVELFAWGICSWLYDFLLTMTQDWKVNRSCMRSVVDHHNRSQYDHRGCRRGL